MSILLATSDESVQNPSTKAPNCHVYMINIVFLMQPACILHKVLVKLERDSDYKKVCVKSHAKPETVNTSLTPLDAVLLYTSNRCT